MWCRSVIFCEAAAIYGVIVTIILQTKLELRAQNEDGTWPAAATFSGYSLLAAGLTTGFANLACGCASISSCCTVHVWLCGTWIDSWRGTYSNDRVQLHSFGSHVKRGYIGRTCACVCCVSSSRQRRFLKGATDGSDLACDLRTAFHTAVSQSLYLQTDSPVVRELLFDMGKTQV